MKNIMKKLALLLALIMVCSVALACTAAPEEKPAANAAEEAKPVVETSAASEAPTENPRIVLTRWSGPHADDQKVVFKKYTDAEIVTDDIDYSNLQQKEIQSMSTTADYDLVWIAEVWLADYVNKGWLLPLDDYIAASKLDLSQYAAGMIEINKVDGKIYALPSFAQTYILTVNKEWFDKEGVAIPTTPEEMVEAAKYFKEKGTGIAIPAGQGQPACDVFATILYGAGGNYFDADGKLALTSAEMLYAATIWDELCQYAIDGSTMWMNDEVSESIRTEKAPFGITISGLCSLDVDPDSSLIIGKAEYLPVPAHKATSGVACTWSWGIPANSKNPQAAFDALTWMIGAEADKEQTLMNAQVSALSTVANDSEVLAVYPFMSAVSSTLAGAKTQPTNAGAASLMSPLATALSTLATTDQTPTDVLAGLQAELADVVTSD